MSRDYCPTHRYHDDPDVKREWHVYYCYAADGTCLYVGMTEHTPTRLQWHALYSGSGEWFPYCARVEETPPFECRWDAHAFEIAEINRLHPVANKHHNRSATRWEPPTCGEPRSYGETPSVTRLEFTAT